jgi:predicted secreted acid phosphatase
MRVLSFIVLCIPLLFISISRDQLYEKEKKILDRIEKSPMTVSTEVVRLDIIPDDHEKCRMLIGDGKIDFDIVDKKEEDKRTTCVLRWKDDRGSGNLSVSSSRGGIFVNGLIYYKNQVYSVEPLGNTGRHAVSLIDQSKAPKD